MALPKPANWTPAPAVNQKKLANAWNAFKIAEWQPSENSARLVVDSYSLWRIATTPAEISAAFRIEDESRIGFWDALIVSSAVKGGANRFLSEDLSAGQQIAGIFIQNPFAGVY